MTEVTKCWVRSGFKCCPHEILLDASCMDILTPAGLLDHEKQLFDSLIVHKNALVPFKCFEPFNLRECSMVQSTPLHQTSQEMQTNCFPPAHFPPGSPWHYAWPFAWNAEGLLYWLQFVAHGCSLTEQHREDQYGIHWVAVGWNVWRMQNVTLPKPYRFSLLVGVKLFCTVGVCNLIPIYFVHNAVGMPQKSLIAGQNQHLGHRQYQGVFPSTISRKYVWLPVFW